jgi:hypothetical protein
MTTAAYSQTTSQSNSSSSVNAVSGASIVSNAPGLVTSIARSRGSLDSTASAFAPGLTSAGINSCAGSISAGGAGTGFNFGFGSTYELDECTARANAAALAGLGLNLAALESLCQSDKMRRAINASGTVCPSQRPEYIAAQTRANETGQPQTIAALEEAPLSPPPSAVRRRRSAAARAVAIDAQASNSGSSLGQSATGRR